MLGVWGRGGCCMDRETGKVDSMLVCWAQDFRVQNLGAKVGSQEGLPTGMLPDDGG